MRKKNFIFASFILFIQIFIVFCLLEIGIRVAGFVKETLLVPKTVQTKNIFTILCVGDSTTEGLGAPKKFSYPAQLQEILDERIGKGKFQVINIGDGGMNSSQVLNRFEKNILRYRPDLVILLIGINDSWNLNESNIYMFNDSAPLIKMKLKINLALSKIKVYQLIKLVILSRRNLELPELSEEKQRYAKSFEHSEEKIRQLYELLSYNINQSIKIARYYKTNIFLQTYQKEGMGNTRRIINQVYKDMGKIPIVNNQALFEEAQRRGLSVISSDNFHPNRLGYSLIAKNVYNTLIAERMINSEKLSYF